MLLDSNESNDSIHRLSNLSQTILNILDSHGPLSSNQLHNLISCYVPFGLVGQEALVNNSISVELNELMLKQHRISYCADNGLWSINSTSSNGAAQAEMINSALSYSTLGQSLAPIIPKVKGVGDQYVYVIYETIDRVAAILSSRSRWMLKVGRTSDLERRIADLNIGGSKSMVVGLAFKTSQAKSLERFIHTELRKRRRQADIRGRREWFFSNLEEIDALRNQFESNAKHVA